MSGHKKDEDEDKQHPTRDELDHDDEIVGETRDWHEKYLDPNNVDVVDGQLTQLPKDHEEPQS